MTRQRYSRKEAILRILRTLQGNPPPSEQPGTLDGELLSENQALSDIAELLAESLPDSSLTTPGSVSSALTTSGFATGTVPGTGLTSVPVSGHWATPGTAWTDIKGVLGFADNISRVFNVLLWEGSADSDDYGKLLVTTGSASWSVEFDTAPSGSYAYFLGVSDIT